MLLIWRMPNACKRLPGTSTFDQLINFDVHVYTDLILESLENAEYDVEA